MKKLLKKSAPRKHALKKLPKKKVIVSITNRDKYERIIIDVLPRVSKNARRRASSNNAPVTIIRGGKIVKIYPSRRERVIGQVKKVRHRKLSINGPIKIK